MSDNIFLMPLFQFRNSGCRSSWILLLNNIYFFCQVISMIDNKIVLKKIRFVQSIYIYIFFLNSRIHNFWKTWDNKKLIRNNNNNTSDLKFYFRK